MEKFNIFEIYGQVHNEKIETPKVEVQSYSPISTKRRTPKVVNGKFSLMESLKGEDTSIQENITYSKDGYVKKIVNLAGKLMKDITINGITYRYNPTYKTYNSVKNNDLLHKTHFGIKESVDGDRTLAPDIKRHFLEIISTYNSFSEQMSRQSDILETAQTLGGVVDAAKELTLAEGNDWFDKITVKRNMNELDKLDKQFDKFAVDAKKMDERLHALYEDMGHILNRYYEISDIDPSVMRERLGGVDEASKATYKHILMLRNDKTDEVFNVGAFTTLGGAHIALQAFKKTAPSHMEYYLTKK